MSVPFDPTALFRALNDHGVDYLVVGGIAAQAHGASRSTLDTDIVIARDPPNVVRLRDAMVAVGATFPAMDPLSMLELHPHDEVDLARARIARIPTPHGTLDLIADPPGADHYPRLVSRAIDVSVDDVTFRVVGLDDLIAMKRTAGRPKDLMDVADLTNPDAG
ncbi:MAG: nucleotidyltransferase [Solirubrobacteraceae bacterium]|nr:nucleotidyltransferase [Solirubrobacteraceae bacterium]